MTTACIPINGPYQSPFFFFLNTGVSETAEELRDLLELTSRDCSISVTNDDSEIFQNLASLMESCSSDNWDGYDAKAIDFDSYSEATRFAQTFPKTIPLPDVTVEPDGEIAFEWYRQPRRVFSISIGSRNVITFAGLFGLNKVNGEEYFGDEIPKTILDNLERLYSS